MERGDRWEVQGLHGLCCPQSLIPKHGGCWSPPLLVDGFCGLGDLVGMRGESCPHAWDALPVLNTHRQVGQGGAVQHPTLLAGMGAEGVQQDGH